MKVSVVIPVHNGMPYLPLTIESIFSTTYADIEVIISNDCSDDGTIEFLRNLNDSTFYIEKQKL